MVDADGSIRNRLTALKKDTSALRPQDVQAIYKDVIEQGTRTQRSFTDSSNETE